MRVELREGLTESSVKRILRKFYIRQFATEIECRASTLPFIRPIMETKANYTTF